MNQFIALLFPASIGITIYNKNINEKNEIQVLLAYMINVLLINSICFFLYYELFHIKTFEFTNMFTIKYIFISSIISIITGIIMTIINKNLYLKVEVKKNEKSSTKSKKNNKNIR